MVQDKRENIITKPEGPISVIVYHHPKELPNPKELNPTKKVLVVIDDCSIMKSDIPTKY